MQGLPADVMFTVATAVPSLLSSNRGGLKVFALGRPCFQVGCEKFTARSTPESSLSQAGGARADMKLVGTGHFETGGFLCAPAGSLHCHDPSLFRLSVKSTARRIGTQPSCSFFTPFSPGQIHPPSLRSSPRARGAPHKARFGQRLLNRAQDSKSRYTPLQGARCRYWKFYSSTPEASGTMESQ